MINTDNLTPFEVQKKAYEILQRELGPTGFIKFLSSFKRGNGDFVAKHREYQENLNVAEVYE